jgi:RNA polymerase sigma-70 factor, ECF subfamily
MDAFAVQRSERTVMSARDGDRVPAGPVDTVTAPSGSLSDDALLVRAAQADRAAFAAIYARYRVPIYRYLRLRCASEDEAADLTQQVFLNALDALPRYRERGAPFAAWLFRIAHNLVANAHRRRGRTVMLDDVPAALWRSDDDDPEEHALRQERLAHLRSLYSTLDDDKQELLALRFGAGLSSSEIAPIVGRSQAAVKKQLTRIIQSLREQYGEPSP